MLRDLLWRGLATVAMTIVAVAWIAYELAFDLFDRLTESWT